MTEKKISRRDFINLSWGALVTLIAAELGLVGLRFLSPRSVEGEFGGMFNLGSFDLYPPGSVTPVEAGRFYMVRLDDGGMMAIYRRCTHLGCAVPYDHAKGTFVCPCHGSEFEADGDLLNPPAPRSLDIFLLILNEDGELIVDTAVPIERDKSDSKQIVYA